MGEEKQLKSIFKWKNKENPREYEYWGVIYIGLYKVLKVNE
jgi:hypothetical protein